MRNKLGIKKTSVVFYLIVMLALLLFVPTSYCAELANTKLPKTITHSVLQSGQHQYTIKGLFWKDGQKESSRKLLEDSYKKDIPNCVTVKIDKTKNSITIITSKEIEDFPKLIDKFARSGGSIPYWVELCMREKRSDLFKDRLYGLVFEKEIRFPDNSSGFLKVIQKDGKCLKFALFSRIVPRNNKTFYIEYTLRYKDKKYFLESDNKKTIFDWQEIEKKLQQRPEKCNLSFNKSNKLLLDFNKTTAFCMCHSRYAMRIFDKDGKYIWEDLNNIHGYHYPMVCDFLNDENDEIIIYREDHGQASILVFSSLPADLFNKDQGKKAKQPDDQWLFKNAVRLTLGRETWEKGEKTGEKEIVIEDPKAIAEIVSKVNLTPLTSPACECIEWMTVETEYTTFTMKFCKHCLKIIQDGKVRNYFMPKSLFEAIRKFYKSKGIGIKSEIFELPGESISLQLSQEERKVKKDTPYGSFCNVSLKRTNTTDDTIMIFPKYTFYAVKDGKAIILRTIEKHYEDELRSDQSLGMSVSLPCATSPGVWEIFAVQSHSDKVYQDYLKEMNGKSLLLRGRCPTLQRRRLPKVTLENIFSNSIKLQFTTGKSGFRDSLRKAGQYHDDYANPRQDPREKKKK